MSSLGRRHTEKKGKAEKVWLGRQSVGETVNYSVLEQVVWQQGLKHCFSIRRKHCNLQCFGASCLVTRLEPLLQHG